MDFLNRFAERDRDRLLAAATTLRLARGDFLIRRGERGGDLFRVAEGELEVIDTRSQPAVVLDVITRGGLVGEMAFIDESARSADVRAADAAVCQRWDRATLIRLLDADATFGSAFYQVLAHLVTERARAVRTIAMSGGLTTSSASGRRGADAALASAQLLASALRDRLMEIEPVIRRDRPLARREVLTALRSFMDNAAITLARMSDEDRAGAGEVIARELHPYVIRSHLGELSLDRPSGHTADTLALAHLHSGRVEGDGPLGEFIDEWLIGLPTARAIRERSALAAQLALERLPPDGAVRIMIINVGCGALFAELLPHLDRVRGELVCLDGSRECLADVDRRIAGRARDLRVRLVQEDLGVVCLGKARVRHADQQIIVIDGVMEYLPERVVAALVNQAQQWLAPGGQLLATALDDTPDEVVFHHLIRWPMIRHPAQALVGLVEGVGLRDVHTYEAARGGYVLVASAPP